MEIIEEFLRNKKYDIRLTGNARWIDQKVTPDVLEFVADCTFKLIENNINREFTKNDVWFNEYTKVNLDILFNKPDLTQKSMSNEYDKFFSQPLELLTYSGVLTKRKKGRTNCYKVENIEMLLFISSRTLNAYMFLVSYIEEVLKQSDVYNLFETFLKEQDIYTYFKLRDNFIDFTIRYTKINRPLEVGRIFTKILNPLAARYKKLGTHRGRLSKHIIEYSDLMYNQVNFRDVNVNKPKYISRRDWLAKQPSEENYQFISYEVPKAKRLVKSYNDQYYDGVSELYDKYSLEEQYEAQHIHHIFPLSTYPKLATVVENLIALTQTQHLGHAHPMNDTSRIDKKYQKKIIEAKIDTVEDSLLNNKENSIYQFSELVNVINQGFETDYVIEDNNFTLLREKVEKYYIENSPL